MHISHAPTHHDEVAREVVRWILFLLLALLVLTATLGWRVP
jgi:hypothetical protein